MIMMNFYLVLVAALLCTVTADYSPLPCSSFPTKAASDFSQSDFSPRSYVVASRYSNHKEDGSTCEIITANTLSNGSIELKQWLNFNNNTRCIYSVAAPNGSPGNFKLVVNPEVPNEQPAFQSLYQDDKLTVIFTCVPLDRNSNPNGWQSALGLWALTRDGTITPRQQHLVLDLTQRFHLPNDVQQQVQNGCHSFQPSGACVYPSP